MQTSVVDPALLASALGDDYEHGRNGRKGWTNAATRTDGHFTFRGNAANCKTLFSDRVALFDRGFKTTHHTHHAHSRRCPFSCRDSSAAAMPCAATVVPRLD